MDNSTNYIDPEDLANEESPEYETRKQNKGGSIDPQQTFDVADKFSGGKLSSGKQQLVDDLGKTKAGQKFTQASQAINAGKKKIADTATKAIRETGSKVAKKGAELAAKAGVSAAAGAATGGLATAAQAGAEVADKTIQLGDKLRNGIKKATGGLIDIDIIGNFRDWLKKYWKKNKWKIIGWSCLAFSLMLFVPVIMLTALIAQFFISDTNDSPNKAAIKSISSMASSGQISFASNQDLNQIKRGEIGSGPLKLMDYLAKSHDKIVINYNPKSSSTDSSTVSGDNEPYEFDIVAVDEIKCTSSLGGEKITIPINLSASYNWTQHGINIVSGEYLCANGYFPQDETVLDGIYAASFGPGEFPLEAIGTCGPMAAQEKLAEITADILDGNSRSGIDAASDNSILPAQIEIDKVYSGPSLKNKSVTVLSELKNKIDAAYPAIESTARQGVIPANKKYGVHVSFLD